MAPGREQRNVSGRGPAQRSSDGSSEQTVAAKVAARRATSRARRAEAPRPRGIEVSPTQAPVEIGPNDPLLAYLQSASGAVEIDALELDSPALAELRAAGVKLVVPLVSQGELIGVLNLGPRMSEQEYSSDDRKLLDNLAAQAAPALRVGQLVREQEAEAVTRQRFEQELEVARLIQQNFLPKELPELPGWQVAAYYQPRARWAVTSTTSFRCPTGGSGSSSATSPTRVCRPRW